MSSVHASLERLHNLYPRLIDLSLERLKRLLADLGGPEQRLPPVIHVAGTNGKGSCCAFIRAIAEAAGLRTHVYTSPHLIHFNERIRIAGHLVTDQALAHALDEIEAVNAGNQITVFEAITAAALLLFSRTQADLCVIEVGLGGTFDATNVIPAPRIAAITSIAMDHQDFLGHELSKIAAEKAGIIKPGTEVVTGLQHPEALTQIQAAAKAAGTKLFARNHNWAISPTATGFLLNNQFHPTPSLPGSHQLDNAAIAIMSLRHSKLPIQEAAYNTGLQTAEWPARLQQLTGALLAQLPPGSTLWLDGAHNPAGAAALATQLKSWPGPTTLIIGMKQSKDVTEFLAHLIPHGAHIYAVAEPNQHLALPVNAIIAASQNTALPGPTVTQALRQIQTPTRVLICGSLYLAGEVLKLDKL